jgi:gliding motility-associated-like protein
VENRDEIADVFREKLSGFEGEVRPELWNAVSSQIAGQTAVGISSITKLMIVLGTAATLVTGVVLHNNSDESGAVKNEQNTQRPGHSQEVAPDDSNIQLERLEPINPKKENYLSKDKPSGPTSETVNLRNDVNQNFERSDANIPVKETETTDPLIVNEETLVTKSTERPQNMLVESNGQESEEPATEQRSGAQIKQLPNVFTPNGDGSNDRFTIDSEGLTDFQIVILNEANKVVYTSSDASFIWDGTMMNGDLAPAGTYLYYITAKDENEAVISRSSLLKLIR